MGDPIILAEDYILYGSEIGVTRPNDNVIIEGCAGVGKTVSCLLPTVFAMKNNSAVMSLPKEGEAYKMARYLRAKGFHTEILNLNDPLKSTVGYDPMDHVRSGTDIESLTTAIVYSVICHTNDDYWSIKAKQLLGALMDAAKRCNPEAGFQKVFDLFDKLNVQNEGNGIFTILDDFFERVAANAPDCYAVREYNSFKMLPYKTAVCVRDTLSGVLNAMFPEDIRVMMQNKKKIEFESLAKEKSVLILVSSSSEAWQKYYTNLFFGTCIRSLLKYADCCPENRLPRPVRLLFDDFACSSRIEGFESKLSLFRSAGLSAVIMLQSQSQLESIYGHEKAAIIRQNCPVHLFFPGGLDERSAELVSKKMNLDFEDVLYAPLGDCFIMQSGKKPVVCARYNTLKSKEYRKYLKIVNETVN